MPKILYTCSSARIDYFIYLGTCLSDVGEVREIYSVDEEAYRSGARSRGLRRILFRMRLYVFYPLKLIRVCLTAPSASTFVVTSNTFYAPLMVAVLGRLKRHKVVHLLYDLFPDALIVAGKIKRDSFLSGILGKVFCWSQQFCHGTVYLGDFLADHAETLYKAARKRAVIDVSGDSTLFAEQVVPAASPVVFHYGGQMGHMHDAENVIHAIRAVWSQPDMANQAQFSFYVSGAQSQKIHASFTNTSVEVVPAVSSEQWRVDIRAFHVGLVTLKPGGATVCLPSKSYSMMAGGLAILAICPPWSDLAKMVLAHDVGWVVSNSPYEEAPSFSDPEYLVRTTETLDSAIISERFAALVNHIVHHPEELDRKRRNASRAMRTHFDKKSLSSRWLAFMESLSNA